MRCRWKATPAGFEPARGDPIGLAGRRLNHSAKVSNNEQNSQAQIAVREVAAWHQDLEWDELSSWMKTLSASFRGGFESAFKNVRQASYEKARPSGILSLRWPYQESSKKEQQKSAKKTVDSEIPKIIITFARMVVRKRFSAKRDLTAPYRQKKSYFWLKVDVYECVEIGSS